MKGKANKTIQFSKQDAEGNRRVHGQLYKPSLMKFLIPIAIEVRHYLKFSYFIL